MITALPDHDQSVRTVHGPVTVAAFMESHSEVNYPAIMAATVLGTIPLLILFVFVNRILCRASFRLV